MKRKVCFILDPGNSCPKADSATQQLGPRVFIGRRRELHVEIALSALIVSYLETGLTSIIFD